MLSLHSIQIIANNQKLIENLSVTFLPSSIVYLKGRNGCGKTSLLMTIAGIKSPAHGKITFGKNNLLIEELKKPYCTYIGHNIGINQELTVYQNLRFWPQIYNSSESLDTAIYYFGLETILDIKCYELSAGNLKKIALTRLLSCRSNLWLLDEVEANLDENHKKLLNHMIILKSNSGGIIFISTHSEPSIKSALVLNVEQY